MKKKTKENGTLDAFRRTRGKPVPPARVVPDRRRKKMERIERRERGRS